MKNLNSRGFSLVEALAGLGIVGLIVLTGFSVLVSARKSQSFNEKNIYSRIAGLRVLSELVSNPGLYPPLKIAGVEGVYVGCYTNKGVPISLSDSTSEFFIAKAVTKYETQLNVCPSNAGFELRIRSTSSGFTVDTVDVSTIDGSYRLLNSRSANYTNYL